MQYISENMHSDRDFFSFAVVLVPPDFIHTLQDDYLGDHNVKQHC